MKRTIVLSLLVTSMLMFSESTEAAVRLGYRTPLIVPVQSANSGELKVDTNAKDASVYINGAFAGTVRHMKTIWLRSGTYNVEVRNTNGGMFDQKVFIPIDKKVVIEPVFTLSS